MCLHQLTNFGFRSEILKCCSRGVLALAFTLSSLTAVVSSAASPPIRPLGPRPGDVYREYAVHNGADDWRVTDPAATAAGAKKFLPNPIIELDIADLDGAIRAEVLLDRWGGHLKTTDKQIRFNNQIWLTVSEIAKTPIGHRPEMYYSQDNPIIEVPIEHLHVGKNTIEGTCGTIDGYGWGQWGLYSVILRIYYDPTSKTHSEVTIADPASGATFSDDPTVSVDAVAPAGVTRVDVIASYNGYDENGDGTFAGWHEAYFQPMRGAAARLSAHVGSASNDPYRVQWNTHWVPDQPPHTIQLVARARDAGGLWAVSPIVGKLTLLRTDVSVKMYRSNDVPEQFGVRVGKERSCRLQIAPDHRPENATEAALAIRTWHGWDKAHHPLRLNGVEMPIGGKNHHYDFDLLPVSPSILRRGDNLFQISYATEHHMLEVLWPGPALIVRYEQSDDAPR